MGVAYATRAQVYRLVPRGAIREASRVVASVDPATDRIELEGHGFEDGDPLQFQIDQGGVLPTPVALLTVYFAKLVDLGSGVKSSGLFQISASSGGAAIDLTTAGSKPFRVFSPLEAIVDAALELFSRRCDRECTMHGVPFAAPYPAEVVDAVVVLTAQRLRRRFGLSGYSMLDDEETAVMRNFASFKRNPLRDTTATPATNTAIAESVTGATIEATTSRGTIP